MHLEFVVVGVPISNQSTGTAALQTWRRLVRAEAKRLWTLPPLVGNLKATVINFHAGDDPSLDLDNMSKPILDVMQGIVYNNDRQIRQAELAHVRIDATFVFVGIANLIAMTVNAGRPFVYVRIENAVDPYPLPKGRP